MDSNSLGNEKMTRLIFRMTLPTIAAQVVNLLYGIVDKIFIGHIPNEGELALAGVGVTTSIIIIITAFASIVGGGGAPVATMEMGRGNHERAGRILGNGAVLLAIMSVVLVTVLYCWLDPILYAVGASEQTIGYASNYLSIYLIGTLAAQITVGLVPFVIAQGKSKVAMASIITGAVLNILLDPLFIFVFGMGVQGAAVATVMSQFVGAGIIIYYLTQRASLRLTFGNLRMSLGVIGSIFALGISPFVMAITESFIAIVMNNGLRKYGGLQGDSYVGALTVMVSVMQFIGVPMSGFGQGVTPVISYNYGAGNYDRVKRAVKITLICLVSYTTSFTLLTMLAPSLFAHMFTDGTNVIDIVTRVLPYFMAGMLIFGVQRTCQTTFIALGQAGISLFIALLRKVILLIPLAIVLPKLFGLGVYGVYYAEPIADVVSAITCGTIFLFRFKKLMSQPIAREEL